MIDFLKKIFSSKKKETKAVIEPLTDKQLDYLKTEYAKLKESASKLAAAEEIKRIEERDNFNNVCPKCKSERVNDRIKRFEGEIKGSSSGHFSFGGSGFSSGKIDGKFDTTEVNKCNDCQNEWKKYPNGVTVSGHDYIQSQLFALKRAFYSIDNVDKTTWDRNDIKEKYKSLEEKKEALKRDFDKNYKVEELAKFWGGYPTEVLIQAVKDNHYMSDYVLDYFHSKEVQRFLLDKMGVRSVREIGFLNLK